MKDDPLKDKSYQFAIRIVKLSQYLQRDKKEFVLSKQVLRSGTAIGALIREAEFGQSKADFTSNRSISFIIVSFSLGFTDLVHAVRSARRCEESSFILFNPRSKRMTINFSARMTGG